MSKSNATSKIKGYENYSATECGNIFSYHNNKILKPEVTKNGYCRVTLSKDGEPKRFLLHRLLASNFIDNPDNKPQINHINGDKQDNRLSNLEWCTQSENIKHSYDSLGRTNLKGFDRYNCRFSDSDIIDIRSLRQQGKSCRFIAREYNCSHQYISELTRGLKRA